MNGKKPPEDIRVIDKLKESKVLRSETFNIKNINNVKKEYRTKIFVNCFNVSVESKVIKLVKDFFKLLSKMSISRIIEDKKYSPPIHWDDDLHKIKLWSKCLIFSNIVKPVEVNPDTVSKYESKKEILYILK